jgi:predicted DNA-binding transcriptional regulator YafY
MGGELCRVVGPSEAKDHMRFLLTERQTSPGEARDGTSNRRGNAALPMPSGPANVRDIVTLAVLCAHNPGVSLDDAAKWLGQPVFSVRKLLRELNDAASEDPAFRFSIESNENDDLLPHNADGLMRVLHLSEGEITVLAAAIELVETSGLDEIRASAAELRRWIQGRDPSNASHIAQAVVREPDPDDEYVVEMVRILASCAAQGEEVRVSHFDADTLERQLCLLVPKCVTWSGGGWTVLGHGLDDNATFEISLGNDATVTPTRRKSTQPIPSRVFDGCDAMESESLEGGDLPFGRVQFKAPLADIIPRAWLPGIGRRAPDGSVTVNHRYSSRHFFFAMLRRYGSAAELIGPDDLRREYLQSLHRIRSYYEP